MTIRIWTILCFRFTTAIRNEIARVPEVLNSCSFGLTDVLPWAGSAPAVCSVCPGKVCVAWIISDSKGSCISTRWSNCLLSMCTETCISSSSCSLCQLCPFWSGKKVSFCNCAAGCFSSQRRTVVLAPQVAEEQLCLNTCFEFWLSTECPLCFSLQASTLLGRNSSH